MDESESALDFRELLKQFALLAPPPQERFRRDLWVRIRALERSRHRRLRATAILSTAVILTAASAAGVLAVHRTSSSSVEARLSCSAASSIAGFVVSTTINAQYVDASIGTGSTYILWTHKPHHEGTVWINRSYCTKSTAVVPLAASGLKSPSLLTVPPSETETVRCDVTHVLVGFRATFNARGLPTAFTIAVRNQRSGKPVEFVNASRNRMTTYLGSVCQSI